MNKRYSDQNEYSRALRSENCRLNALPLTLAKSPDFQRSATRVWSPMTGSETATVWPSSSTTETLSWPARRYFASVVIHRRETDVVPLVVKHAHIVDLHAVMFRRIVLCLLERRIGESFRDPPPANLLVKFVGMEYDAVIMQE